MGSLPGWLVTQGTAGEQRTQGSWIGESLPAIPQRLLEKLQRWEFADLAELRPLGATEALNPDPDPQRHIILPGLEVSRPKKKQVTDIISWTQCFLVYIAIMHQKFPDKVPKMIAYMLTILRAQQEFEDPGWRIYDHNYRLKAAASGNQNWAELDPHLYSQCFTGRAKKVPACAKCNSFRHAQEDCPHGSLLAIQGQQIPEPPAPAESSVSGQRPFKYRSGGKVRSDICFAFDRDGSCPYKVCRFKHMRSKCGGRHPAFQCRRSVKGREEARGIPQNMWRET